MPPQTGPKQQWQNFIADSQLWLFAIVVTVVMGIILSFRLEAAANVAVELGQPAPNDVFAPSSLTYSSELLTVQAQEQAKGQVEDQYTPLDMSIGRAQLTRAQAIFEFVDTVRADTQATTETKLKYLQAVEGLTIEEQVGIDLLSLNSADYQIAREDVLEIIDVIMRQDIREGELSDFRRSARREASLELTLTQNNVVTNLAPQFIAPTIFLDESATQLKRDEAATGVQPISRTIAKDQRILQAGEIVTETHIEILSQLGLLQQEVNWRDTTSIFLASLLVVVLILLYWRQFYTKQRKSGRYLTSLATLWLLFILIAKLVITLPGLFSYLYPVAAMSMLLAVIFDVRMAMLVTVLMSAVVGYIAPNSLELAVYTAAGGLVASLTLHDAVRINAFFRAGLMAAVGHLVVIVIFWLPQETASAFVPQLVLYSLVNGVLSAALTLVGFFIMGSLFGVTTTLQLQELSRLDHPLLQDLLRRAPGTYHHSIMVAHLAEQAAERIKANSTLVRVGAFYHDIGKMTRPPFFAENQEGVNPHESLDPFSSARIIISHVSDGLEMARRHRLPDRIRDFIAEHHGDRVLKTFYTKAKEQSGTEPVDIERFRHRGPRPRSRETGIVMLADAIEATSSALRPNSEKAIEKLVNSLVDEHLTEGQLDDSSLTLGDVSMIRASFIDTLKGRFHVRVKYPGNESLVDDAPTNGAVPVVANQPVVGNQ